VSVSVSVWLGLCELTVFRYDQIHNIRKTLVEALKKEFPDYGLT
jgi:hypothetical protein